MGEREEERDGGRDEGSGREGEMEGGMKRVEERERWREGGRGRDGGREGEGEKREAE